MRPAPAAPTHPSLLTVVSVAVVACAGADLVHELLGHGTASWLAGDRILSISSVALQNAEANRFVSACGTMANVLAGGVALLLLRRLSGFSATACFLWLFGAFNLCNLGYLVFSAALGSGDWAAVIAGLEPPWLWRIALALVGVVTYGAGLRWIARSVREFVRRGDVAPEDVRRLVVPAYVAGGILMTAASLLNPIGPSLVLIAGVGASFGLNAGLLFVPAMVGNATPGSPARGPSLPLSRVWLLFGLVVAVAYVAVLGPGIRFAP